jgi:hypothetical protein
MFPSIIKKFPVVETAVKLLNLVRSSHDFGFSISLHWLVFVEPGMGAHVCKLYCESLTFAAGGFPVGLADEAAVLGEVELVAGGELPGAKGAREAVEVEDVLLRAPHHLRRRNALVAAGALGAESPTE